MYKLSEGNESLVCKKANGETQSRKSYFNFSMSFWTNRESMSLYEAISFGKGS